MWEQVQESWNNLSSKMIGWFDTLIYNLPNIALALIVSIIAYLISRFVRKYLQKLLRKTSVNPTLVSVTSNVATVLFLILGLLVVLSILNLDKALTSLLAGAGVAGLTIGLALQDPMINFFSGILMSVRSYYQEGDLIESNGYMGQISKVSLRSTVLLQLDGQEVIIPNKDVLQNPLVNYSHNGRRRIEVQCGVSYRDDLDKVREVVQKAIEENPDLPNSKPIEVFFYEFGDSSINFALHFWQNSTSQRDYLAAKDHAIRTIKKTFEEQGITIPFPIRTLEVQEVNPTILSNFKN